MSFAFDILRPDDLLTLRVEAVNLRVDTSRPAAARLVVDRPGQEALLVFQFPPQSVAEQAFFQTAPFPPPAFNPPPVPPLPSGDDKLLAPGSVQSRMAGDSRLVFRLPTGMNEIAYDTAALLDWSRLELVLPPAARVAPGVTPTNPPAIAEPGPRQTAIELPWRLLIAPTALRDSSRPGWRHAARPVVHAGRTELWHTRLVRLRQAQPNAPLVAIETSDQATLPLRGVWSPDFVADGPLPPHSEDDQPFRSAMSPRDRDQIVILTSGFLGYRQSVKGVEQAYRPLPVNASKLYLSGLGGWLTSRGAWPDGVFYRYPIRIVPLARPVLPQATAPLDLVEWAHVATQGRDHYVRIVYDGFLYPFGHRASLVKVTERMVSAPDPTVSTSPVAYMRQRMYIVVREREKTYTGAPYNYAGREMPLRQRVRIETRVTPEIDPPTYFGTASFWVDVGTGHFGFHLSGTDLAGQTVDFIAPLIFIGLSETSVTPAQTAYLADDTQRRCVVRGQNVAYADPTAGDTVLKTNALYFSAQLLPLPAPWTEAPFLPTFDRAAVTVPAIAELTGSQTATVIGLYPQYLQAGIDPNAGVFAEVMGGPPGVGFSADKAGGFATPNIGLTALSARKGLVAGSPDNAAAGTIKPSDYFGPTDARLFGTIPLGSLLPVDPTTLVANAAQNAPEIRSQAVPNRRHSTKVITHITWAPQLQSYSQGPVSITFNQQSALTLKVQLERNLDGTPPASSAHGKLTNFRLDLLGVVGLQVTSITFTSQNAQKTTVAVQLANSNAIGFEGPLAFIQTLANILPPGLFGGSGPSIKTTPTALSVSYTLGLPPTTAGVFSLQNIAIMAGVDLPYVDGKPGFEFAFASRNRPFLVTVEIFGGGGFVHVVVNADGVQMVEGAIEFGGNFAFDIGVASGGVHAMAGIYFQLQGSKSDLTGFVDIGGEVSVLGIISISLDLNLSLSWQHSPQGDVIQGRASLTVSVHVLFFSASVQISVERSFKAGAGDPQVAELMNRQDWASYAGAFG